ncbi:MAG: OmpH family outer membrane protein [Planctomycetaceae bacterium]
MKKAILSASVLALFIGSTIGVMNARGQNEAPPAKEVPHKVGLIDMAEVFKEYTKFKDLRDQLKAQIEETDKLAKSKGEEIQGLQEQMKALKSGSPDFVNLESQLAKLTSEFETFRKVKQREFLREEAAMYHEIYKEVTDLVGLYAERFGYTLVLRFNKEDLNTDDPQQLIQGMNRQVVYSRENDDITDEVVKYLNKKYAGPAEPSTTPRPRSVKPASKTN